MRTRQNFFSASDLSPRKDMLFGAIYILRFLLTNWMTLNKTNENIANIEMSNIKDRGIR